MCEWGGGGGRGEMEICVLKIFGFMFGRDAASEIF